MKHTSVPAYTMGPKYLIEPITTNKLSPSPNTYNVRPQEIIVPTTRFGLAPRSISAPKSDSPGPGAYPIRSFVEISLKVSKGKRHKPNKDKNEKSKIDSPGPTSYHPSKPKTSISFSMGNKVHNLSSVPSPITLGPGEYNANYDSIKPVKANTIGKSIRDTGFVRSDHPGPGCYDIMPIQDSPKYGFGREERCKLIVPNYPAPGEYNIPGLGDEASKKMGKTMLPKRPIGSDDNNVPGPGAYNAKLPIESPSFSVGKDKRSTVMVNAQTPGPGAYTPAQSPGRSPGKSIGNGIRPPMSQCNNYPGPGSYEAPSYIAYGPKYSLLGRKGENRDGVSMPGPGHYEPDFQAVKGQKTHAIIGTGKRIMGLRPGTLNVPGPGAYEPRERSESPRWTFKRGPRDPTSMDDDPGPGQYEITATIPDVPKYLLTGSRKK